MNKAAIVVLSVGTSFLSLGQAVQANGLTLESASKKFSGAVVLPDAPASLIPAAVPLSGPAPATPGPAAAGQQGACQLPSDQREALAVISEAIAQKGRLLTTAWPELAENFPDDARIIGAKWKEENSYNHPEVGQKTAEMDRAIFVIRYADSGSKLRFIYTNVLPKEPWKAQKDYVITHTYTASPERGLEKMSLVKGPGDNIQPVFAAEGAELNLPALQTDWLYLLNGSYCQSVDKAKPAAPRGGQPAVRGKGNPIWT